MSPYRDTVNGNSAALADFAMDMEKTSDGIVKLAVGRVA